MKYMNTASILRRIGARGVDTLLIFLLFAPTGYFFSLPVNSDGTSRVSFMLSVMMFGTIVAYNVFFHGASGQTLGKRLLRIQVLDLDGSRLRLAQVWMRNLPEMYYIVWLLVDWAHYELGRSGRADSTFELFAEQGLAKLLFAGVKLTSMMLIGVNPWVSLFSAERRALHDYLANTRVVAVQRHGV